MISPPKLVLCKILQDVTEQNAMRQNVCLLVVIKRVKKSLDTVLDTLNGDTDRIYLKILKT